MTQAEQWAQINYPSFFGAIGQKIMSAREAMTAIPVNIGEGGDWLLTNVNNVPIWWQELGDDVRIRVGTKDADQTPMYDFMVPLMWLAA